MALPKLCIRVEKKYDFIEKIHFYSVNIDVYEKGPNLTKEQADEIAESISKYFGIIKVP